MAPLTTAASGDQSPRSGSSAKPSRPTGRRSASASSKTHLRQPRLFRFDRALGVPLRGRRRRGRPRLPGRAAGRRRRAVRLRDAVAVGPALAERAERLQAAHAGDARAAVPARAAGGGRASSVTSRCVRGIDERGLHKTNLAALSDTLRRVGVDGRHLPVGRLPGARRRASSSATSSAATPPRAAIAAASVIAKVTRDRFMQRMEERYPGWEFGAHVGYSTPEHRAAIAKLGVSPLHRHVVPVDGVPAARALSLADVSAASSHGAWHGGWCWRDVAAELTRGRARRARADLVGLAERGVAGSASRAGATSTSSPGCCTSRPREVVRRSPTPGWSSPALRGPVRGRTARRADAYLAAWRRRSTARSQPSVEPCRRPRARRRRTRARRGPGRRGRRRRA